MLGSGIDADDVAISIDYASEGFDPTQLSHPELEGAGRYAVAQSLIRGSDCRTCHTVDVKAVGPSFMQIAERYNGMAGSRDALARRIVNGSTGVWGTDNNMPAHPSMSLTDARTIAEYILNVNRKPGGSLPEKGKYVFNVPKDDSGKGTYIFRVAYTDRGAGEIPPLTTDTVLLLRSPLLNPLNADSIGGGAIRDQLDEYVFVTARPNSFISFDAIDLSGIREISFRANWHLYDIYAGGKIEIRIDNPDGQLIGETTIEREQFNTRYRGLFDGLTNPDSEQQKRMKRYAPIDASRFFAPGANKNSYTIPSTAPIVETSTIHDVYFVFKGQAEANTDALFPLAEVELRRKVK